jgi:hypothetical protein
MGGAHPISNHTPCWKLLCGHQPPGTYYYQSEKHLALQWCLPDQVVISPDLIKNFDLSALNILTSLEGTALLKAGKPCISDHLPLEFSLKP